MSLSDAHSPPGEVANLPSDRDLRSPTGGEQTSRKVLWGLGTPIFFVIIFIYLDRSNIAFAAPQLQADLALTPSQYGLGSGLLFAGATATQIPLTFVAARNPKLFISTTLVIWGAIAAATSAVKHVGQFYAMRFLLGCAEAGAFPSIWYLVSGFTNSRELNLTWAASLSATAASQVIGAPIAAGLLYMDGLCNLRGWQWLFIIEGLVTCIYGLIVQLALPAGPKHAWFLTLPERHWLQQRQDQNVEAARTVDAAAGSYLAPLRTWRIWYMGAAWFPLQCAAFAVVFWTPLMLGALLAGDFSGQARPQAAKPQSANPAVEAAKLALLSSVVFVPAGITMVAVAYSSARRRERNLHVGLPCLCTGVALLLVPTLSERAGAIATIIAIAVAACGAWAVGGPVWSWPATFMHGPGSVIGVAIFNTFGAVGGFVGPIIVGNLSDQGNYSKPMYILGAFSILSGLMYAVFPAASKDRDLDKEDEEDKGLNEGN